MEINNSKTIKINFISLFFIGGSAITLLLISIYFLLGNIYGRFEVLDIVDAVKKMEIIPKSSDYSAAILFSENSDDLLSGDNNWYENNIRTWQKFAESSELNLDVIDDEILEKEDLSKFQLLILPTSKALSDKQIIQVKNYLEDGGNIFATNSIATFDETGEWRGWKFFNEVFGTKFVHEFPADGDVRKQSFRGGLALTAGIPSGFALRIATWDSPMACTVLEPRTEEIGFWNEFRSNKNKIVNTSESMTSVVSGNYGKGRFVWMGFDINSVYGEQEEYVMFERFFKNIINWLTSNPIIFIKDWPSDYKSSAVVNVVSDGEISSLQPILKYVDNYKLPVSFFVDSELASKDVIKLKMLSEYGDIGAFVSLGNLTSARNISYQLDNYAGQYERLLKAKEQLESLVDKNVNSAMPSMGHFDENTIHALIESGYQTLVTDSLLNKSVPNSQIKGDDQIISINKTGYSDVEILENYGLDNIDFQMNTFKEDIDRVILEGGIYNLTLHANIWSKPEYQDKLDELFTYMQHKGLWITSSDELTRWWTARNSIEVGTKVISPRRVSFLITNPSNVVIDDLTVQIDLNKNISNLVITSEIIGTEIPEYTMSDNKIFLKLKNLNINQSISYFIDFDNVLF